MNRSISARPIGHRNLRRHLARLLQALVSRVTVLTVRADQLRARVASAPAYAHLRACIGALLHELQTDARQLAAPASALGARIDLRRTRASTLARTRQKHEARVGLPMRLAGALLAECRACGARLCTLLQTAQAAHDDASMRTAYGLIRSLEKQLWILRPHVESAHPFPPVSGAAA